MHRLPNNGSLLRFRFAAVLILLKWPLIPGSLGFLLYALVLERAGLIYSALGVSALTVLMFIIQWLVATKCRCPLCVGLPLCNTGAMRNRNARRLFGSYRLRVAQSIVMQGHFRCPYCGESTAMEVRERGTRRRSRR
ncbi:MAG: hypothetical protein K9N23_10895 [Akkermansiaceae bacterium]|nr:hypothetical protein [Akkermansiaceae bacterium]